MDSLTWHELGPVLIGALGALITAIAVIVWAMVRSLWRSMAGLREKLDTCATGAQLKEVEDRLRAEVVQLAFRFERHDEASTARWVNKPE